MANPTVQGLQIRIALLGRRGVGKTSIIAAVLDEAKRLMDGSPLQIIAADEKTQELVETVRSLLLGALYANTFNYKAIPANVDEVRYALMMTTQGVSPLAREWTDFLNEAFEIDNPTILFNFRDYPGGWGDPSERDKDPESAKGWREYLRWIDLSQILIIPIDAAFIMEPPSPEEMRRVPAWLGIPHVTDVVERWLKSREGDPLPGLLVLAPLRCESYFDDNGGEVDRSAELFEKCTRLYQPVLDLVKKSKAKARLTVPYHPIDTVGSARVASARWPEPHDTINVTPEIAYTARPPFAYRPKGAADLLLSLNRHLLKTWAIERNIRVESYTRQSAWEKLKNWEKAVSLIVEWFTKYPAFRDTMKQLNNGSYDNRTKIFLPGLHVRARLVYYMLNDDIVISNLSAFPLTNVKMKAYASKDQDVNLEAKILPCGEEIRFADCVSVSGKGLTTPDKEIRVELTCDQGTFSTAKSAGWA